MKSKHAMQVNQSQRKGEKETGTTLQSEAKLPNGCSKRLLMNN
jgi:hypothetical protein